MKKIIAEAEFTAEQLNIITELTAATGLCEQTVRILVGRGVDTAEKIDGFIHAGRQRFLSPFLMSGMKRAVELITRAREEDWSVAVYGDYDADGICASAILTRALADFGIDAVTFVPERKNGYGLSVEALDEIFEEYFPQLFITVDCGISNAQEVEYIKEQGAEVIVTDHHELPEILPDCICINPKIEDEYPYDNLCGAGVAFKLACALNGKDAYKYLDFAAIATVADSVPLTGENRDIVAEGLTLINARPRKNYAEFLKKDEKVTSQSLAFSIAPKINAAGRMGDARAALALFLSDDGKEIYDYSVKLTAYNIERQKYCDGLYLSAKEMLRNKGAHGRVIVLCGEDWNTGFVGIVAARLAEEYCRPALLFVNHGGKLKGSARSIDGVNIFEALKACSHLIEEFGGHAQAAGVNVDQSNIQALEKGLNDYLKSNYTAEAFTPSHCVNGQIVDAVSAKWVKELDLLEPFGVGNRRPQFVVSVKDCKLRPLKEGSPHLAVKCGNTEYVYFSGAKFAKLLRCPLPKQMIADFAITTFRGKQQISGYVRDIVYDPCNCASVGGSVNVNGISALSYDKIDCVEEEISKEQAQNMLNDSGEYGTLFIASCHSTLEKYDCNGLEVNIFVPSASNLADIILLSPSVDCDLSGYERVVYLDNPVRITQPSLAGKKVYVCKEVDGAQALCALSAEREQLLSVFKFISANGAAVCGGSLEEIAESGFFETAPEQALFALKVFEQLGLITFKGGRINVNRAIKTQLTNSDLYNLICSLNG